MRARMCAWCSGAGQMIRRILLMTAAALALATPALAVSPEDAVDGHPGVTYGVLLKQIAPDLAKDDKDIFSLSVIKNLRVLGAPAGRPRAGGGAGGDRTGRRGRDR